MGYKSPQAYALFLRASSIAPADSTTYYFGNATLAWTTVANACRVYILKTGIVRAIQFVFQADGGATAEDVTFILRKNNTTDYAITTSGLNAPVNYIANLALAIPVIAGDYFEIKVMTPAWVTNPTGVTTAGNVLIECE